MRRRRTLALLGVGAAAMLAIGWSFRPPDDGAVPHAAAVPAPSDSARPTLAPGWAWLGFRDNRSPPLAAPRPGVTVQFLAPPNPIRLGVDELLDVFARPAFAPVLGEAAHSTVPRLYVANLPADLAAGIPVDKRKLAFTVALLPLILKSNEDIGADRRRLLRLAERLENDEVLEPAEQLWLERLAARYGVAPEDIAALIERVDVVPPSLALAQGAEESGWGTSRFAHVGNAIFGQRTWTSGSGIRPFRRDRGERFEIRKFSALAAAITAYMHNLNTHPAYEGFRTLRARVRAGGDEPTGHRLVGTLAAYSVRGASYVEALRTIMQRNALERFDATRLSDRWADAAVAGENF